MSKNTTPCTSNCGVKNHEIGSHAHKVCQERTTAMAAHPAGKGKTKPTTDFDSKKTEKQKNVNGVTHYNPEKEFDDGTMVENIDTFANRVIGHKIISAEPGNFYNNRRNYCNILI